MTEKNTYSHNKSGGIDCDTLMSAREWMAEPPPGLERLAGLPVPELPVGSGATLRRRSYRARLRQTFVAAAALVLVFGAGYHLGSRHSSEVRMADETEISSASASPNAASLSAKSSDSPTTGTSTGVVVAEVPAPSPDNPPQFARGENGRVLIDTRLRGNGSHVTWVIDGSFQLAQSSSPKSNHGDYQ